MERWLDLLLIKKRKMQNMHRVTLFFITKTNIIHLDIHRYSVYLFRVICGN